MVFSSCWRFETYTSCRQRWDHSLETSSSSFSSPQTLAWPLCPYCPHFHYCLKRYVSSHASLPFSWAFVALYYKKTTKQVTPPTLRQCCPPMHIKQYQPLLGPAESPHVSEIKTSTWLGVKWGWAHSYSSNKDGSCWVKGSTWSEFKKKNTHSRDCKLNCF